MGSSPLTGCSLRTGAWTLREPRWYGHKAVHKDTQEHLLYITGCSEARKREVCEGPLKDPVECEKCQ